MKLTISMLTLFISYFSFAQPKLKDLKVDTSITGFHFAADVNGTFVYTSNGKSDLTANKGFSYFALYMLPNATMESAFQQFEILHNNSIQDGFNLSEFVENDTTINGNQVYAVSFTKTKGTNKILVFNAATVKNKTAIIFTSSDNDQGKHRENIKKTFYAMKL
jgi:hypothetical protein